MPTFLDLVAAELKKARDNFPPMNNEHEGYAVLLEEVDEFWDWVKQNQAIRSKSHGLSELVQVAAMACRIAEDCNLMEPQ
jgi:hypothetical protein